MATTDGKNITRSDDLRNENRRRVLDALRASGPCSAAQLSDDTGLSAASISSLTSQLADQGIVTSGRLKSDNVSNSRGRPRSVIALDATAGDIVVVKLTIDNVSVHRVNYAGELLHSETLNIDTRLLSENELLDVSCNAVRRFIAMDESRNVARIGVAFQGVTENVSGVLAWSPIIAHANVNLGAVLQEAFQLPVTLNNDCRLIAEALSLNSAGLLGKSFATMLFSHGVGLGLYIDGKPFSGIRTSALELGHLCFERDGALCRCGKRGCIEAYAADYGIHRLATGQPIHDAPPGRLEEASINNLCKAGQAGDEPAKQAFVIAGAAVGEGLNTLFTLFDAMPVALVGRSQQVFELMRTGVHSVFRERAYMGTAIDDLLHCFDDADPLLQAGLIHNTLSSLDRQFAYTGNIGNT